ncbi:MAG: PTS sugar transporter subunit IIA [Spirochaetota bacterium]|jgi:PTS system nitrogen regulatory IIA component|uniref:PTS sugar transporter subunit IIA n=1 Tax=Gracilinema caldarium TaxID=215591 RepID=UPI001695BFB0|nr:PTS sugar transporter subunit IIA [Gracilinema caldarium]NLJ08708.1 PTS sugar transporter subunit IIA [Treponema sp.]
MTVQSDAAMDISSLIERGGVFYNIGGNSVTEVLSNLVDITPMPPSLTKEQLKKAIIEREELMPTAVGNGIALPHPRSPLLYDMKDQFITIAFLQKGIDWKALDGQPVQTLILIVSATPKTHLWTLARISFLCQQESFRNLLEQRASKEELIAAIRSAEVAWK